VRVVDRLVKEELVKVRVTPVGAVVLVVGGVVVFFVASRTAASVGGLVALSAGAFVAADQLPAGLGGGWVIGKGRRPGKRGALWGMSPAMRTDEAALVSVLHRRISAAHSADVPTCAGAPANALLLSHPPRRTSGQSATRAPLATARCCWLCSEADRPADTLRRPKGNVERTRNGLLSENFVSPDRVDTL
jgi:hypothetical protein